MNITVLLQLFKKYKLFIFPVLLLLFFLYLIFISLFPASEQKQQPFVAPTPISEINPTGESTPAPSENSTTNQQASNDTAQPNKFNETDLQNVLKKETLSDGSIQYTYASENPDRPDMMIVKDGSPVYQRSIIRKRVLSSINSYTFTLGEPNAIVQGSKFYGSDKVTYLYPDLGIAFVADPVSNLVLEQDLFVPMTASEYKDTYGEDLTGSLQ